MEKIFLIDGSSMLSTQYYGNLPPAYTFAKTPEDKEKALEKALKTSDGLYTNGLFGMTKAILKLIEKEKPEYLVVCWDISRQTFRRDLYPEYKAHRSETHISLKSQFDLTQQTLKYIGIPTFSLENYEADDLIGTIAEEMSKENEVVILTKDQDALQLINQNTTVWLNTKNAAAMSLETEGMDLVKREALPNYFPFTDITFEHFYGIKPKQIIDLKAICGDKSDGIPGVPGFGDKTITPLLAHFGTIEDVFHYINNTDEKAIVETFKKENIKRIKSEKLKQYEDQIILSKKLATIDCFINEFKTKEKEEYRMILNKEKMKKIFTRLEFNSLL